MNQIKGICFFCPDLIVGGYAHLFYRLAVYYANNFDIPIYYVGFEKGFFASQPYNPNIKHIFYTEDMEELVFDDEIILTTPITWFGQIPKIIIKNNKKLKELYWVAHPNSYAWLKGRKSINDAEIRYYITELHKKNALCYMDLACYDHFQKDSDMLLSPVYTPIFTNNKDFTNTINIKEKDTINIAWLGRLDYDKIFSILNFLDNFSQYQTSLKKKFHIIGDGVCRDEIKQENYSDIEIIFTSILINNERDEYLVTNVDILFAMGTSLLEGASLKIPAVLTPLLVEKSTIDEYLWIYELDSYNLGFYPEDTKRFGYSPNKLKTLLDDIYKNNQYEFHKQKSYEYFCENHSIEIAIAKLNEAFSMLLPTEYHSILESSNILNKKKYNKWNEFGFCSRWGKVKWLIKELIKKIIKK